METQNPAVLVVDDEPRLADLFATWVEDRWPVAVANDGEEALAIVDESIEVVLLDRRMPGMSGDDVLDEIQARELDCRIIMVTAIDPDFDILEMPFDDYLVKPVTRDELIETVELVRQRSEYDEKIREYYALVSKKAVLDTEKPAPELAESEEYDRLTERIERLRREVDGVIENLSTHEEFVGAFRDLQHE